MARAGQPSGDMRKTVVHEVTDKLVGGLIERQTSFVPTGNEPQAAQQRQLVAHGRQGEVEGVSQVAYRQLVVGERVKDTDTDWVCQRLEDFDGFVHDLGARHSLACDTNASRIQNCRQIILANFHK